MACGVHSLHLLSSYGQEMSWHAMPPLFPLFSGPFPLPAACSCCAGGSAPATPNRVAAGPLAQHWRRCVSSVDCLPHVRKTRCGSLRACAANPAANHLHAVWTLTGWPARLPCTGKASAPGAVGLLAWAMLCQRVSAALLGRS